MLNLKVKGQNIPCEKIEIVSWVSPLDNQVTCDMQPATSINSTGVLISERDETVGAIVFTNNENIRFLPENTAACFPKLLMFSASYCSIESISYSNFKTLENLEHLYLKSNKIKKIESNTFEDLHLLRMLDLGEKIILSTIVGSQMSVKCFNFS